MKKFKSILVIALAIMAVLPASAEERTKSYPYAFFGLQGGGQAVLNGYNIGDVITGTASLYVGGMWCPVVGTRLHVNGWESREGIKNWGTYDFKYGTATVDVMFNLVSAINHRDNNAVDFYLIGGLGANKVWGNNWSDAAEVLGVQQRVHNHVTNTGKLGAMLDINFSRYVAFNVEVDAYHHGPHDKLTRVNMSKDWQLTGQLGLKFSFPHKAKGSAYVPPVVEAEPIEEVAPVVEEVVEPAPAPQPVVAPVVAPEPAPAPKAEMRTTVYYVVGRSVPNAANCATLAEVTAWLKANPSANALIEGYADRGTGNARINERLARQRAHTVKKSLEKEGIDAARLTVKSYGDTVQPFAENDKNRCVIITAAE